MPETDLDTGEAIDAFVDRFYARVLADPLLAPVFIDTAQIELGAHLPRIKAFWRKMILGESGYSRNMVAQHARVHAHTRFERAHFARWVGLFEATLDAHYAGPYARHTRTLARTIATNLERNLDRYIAAS